MNDINVHVCQSLSIFSSSFFYFNFNFSWWTGIFSNYKLKTVKWTKTSLQFFYDRKWFFFRTNRKRKHEYDIFGAHLKNQTQCAIEDKLPNQIKYFSLHSALSLCRTVSIIFLIIIFCQRIFAQVRKLRCFSCRFGLTITKTTDIPSLCPWHSAETIK